MPCIMDGNSHCASSLIIHSDKLSNFVQEKSTLVNFRPQEKESWQKWTPKENTKDFYAVCPPLDSFMSLEKSDAVKHLWNSFDRGDIVVVRVSSIFGNGLNVNLLSFDAGKSRELDKYKIDAWCSVSEIPKVTNHEDVLLRFSVGDILRLCHNSCKYRKGKVEPENLPLAYQRQVSMEDSYEDVLCKSVGFVNPGCVGYLMSRLCIPSQSYISITKALHSKRYMKEDYADHLRKRQSRKVADASVKKGIKKFKSENYIEALQDFNYALDMDTENVDALVARGALYANRGTMSRAIHDFEGALKIEPDHKNAKKYLVAVLIDRAKQIGSQMHDINQVKEVEKCYLKALSLDPNCKEARLALDKIAEEDKNAEKGSDSGSSSETEKYAAAARKLKKILKTESSIKKKRIIYSSSSSSSSGTDSEDTSSRGKRRSSPKTKSMANKYNSQLPKEKGSMLKRRHSDVPRAIIQSNVRKNNRRNVESRRSFDANNQHNKRPQANIPSTNLTKVTKENFTNILKEISKFEVHHKS
uniref:tetratricopeptide repeat protein 14-like n=1 Tax=Styela clava TaxID=7725 RepID=UPI00193AD7DF|nr:tetratricopeptide repeat protein 14-like [Styela clava]